MHGIQFLERGTPITLAGGVPALVEDNPRDGVWLVARYARPLDALLEAHGDPLAAAARSSEHGMNALRNADSLDVIVVVHAEDILGRQQRQGNVQ